VSAFALGMRMMQHTLFNASTLLIVVNLALPLVVLATYSAMASRKADQRRGNA
jgi:ABC-type spermidine/putrescine transport system permease subunit II